ncbi:hypothetical protein ACOMHN_037631 [Nucella lapillus]
MTCFDACYRTVKAKIGGVFNRYGQLVGRHPLPFIIVPIIVFGSLGLGLIALEQETDLETVYFPKNSRAINERQCVRDTFPSVNDVSYNGFSQSDNDLAASIIFKTKSGQSVFDPAVNTDISDIVTAVKGLTTSAGKTYSNFCAKNSGKCVVDGEQAFDNAFKANVTAGTITYPFSGDTNLATSISGVKLDSTGTFLKSASVLKISFKLKESTADWEKKFLDYAGRLGPTSVDVAYEIPDSLSEELDKSTQGDIIFFSLTITVVCVYASVVTTGGNPVSTRGMLSCAGILAAGLGIVGSMGLLSACGVKFVNIVGVIPFLIIGIGVDDMFLLMSSWSESLPSDDSEQNVQHVPRILGKTLASAGIGITITSLTDFLAFVIGTASVFRSVTYFSLYAGVAVLFCYLANVTVFSGCLAFHGRRVYSWRHAFTCMVTKSRDDLKTAGRSACCAVVCGGNPPKKARDDESVCELLPSRYLPRIFKRKVVSVIILVFFLGYLAAAIYGAVNLKQGLVLQDLVLDSSYYSRYLNYADDYFPTQFPLSFVADKTLNYSGNEGTQFQNVLTQARKDSGIDSDFERCWLTSYKQDSGYNAATFMSGLPTFLSSKGFEADVVMDSAKSKVLASRCFVTSAANADQYSNAQLMGRMREVADGAPVSVFAYHPAFVAFEQFLAVLPATVLLVGCAVAVMTVVTFIFLPHLLMVLLVVLTIVMILTGIFGFLYYWNLTLSSITMIHLVMSVGFSVDFSAHVCAAYLLSDSESRQERASDAIRHAAGPILNGAISTMLGVLFLLLSSSFIFQSFFRVMFLVILFGLLHAVFFLPAVLSLLGPENRRGNTVGPEETTDGATSPGDSEKPHANGTAAV